MTVGTSALVHPDAGLVQETKNRGGFTVQINLEPTPASAQVDLASTVRLRMCWIR